MCEKEAGLAFNLTTRWVRGSCLPLETLEMSGCPVGTCPEGKKRMEAGSETRIWHGSAKDDD